MSRMLTRTVLAGAAALGIGLGTLSVFPMNTVRIATAPAEPPADAQVEPQQAAWQQQWELLLRREEQLRRDQQQVQEIAPRLQPNVVDQLQQGLELTQQRLAQRRQPLLSQQPPADPAMEVPRELAAGSPMPPRPAIVAWPGS